MKGLFPKIGELILGGAEAAKSNSSTLLTGLAVGGVILTAVLAAKAVPRAKKAVEEERERRKEKARRRAEKEQEVLDKDYDEVYEREYVELDRRDIFKYSIKYFVPAIVTGALTIGCIVGAQHINTAKQAALAASYEIARNSFDTYREEVRESLDRKKFEEIEERYSKRRMEDALDNHPVTQKEFDLLDVESGAGIFVDPTTGHHFVSTYEKVYNAVDDVIDMLSYSGGGYNFVSLPTFLHMAGDKSNDFPKCAEHIGFMTGGFDKAIDKQHFLKPQEGWHKGHQCTLIVMATDIALHEVFDRSFTR